MKTCTYDLTHPYSLSGVGYVQLNLNSGRYDLSEAGYVKLKLYLKFLMYILA